MLTVVSFGGGDNSTALLIGMVEKKHLPPHAILFADTGGEFPHTYAHIELFSRWLTKRGYPAIHTVRHNRADGSWESLEDECLRREALPAIAYGFRTCSQKFKIAPQDKWMNNDPTVKAEWEAGRRVRKYVGYDFGEFYRAKFYDDEKFVLEYPLIDWRWDRKKCTQTIIDAGMQPPGKSSCFFCPNMKKGEVRYMRDYYPDLLERALTIESNANLETIVGLGRRWSWREFLKQRDLPLDEPEDDRSSIICDCFEAADTFPKAAV